ncbi:MAG: PPOX class F420-dependent oxidoreductase, partial [Actinomycetota bacterium]
MGITDEKYVAFTTYTKAGAAKTTPVWIADLGDGRAGFTTSSTSWKAKRLANDSRVELQPSDSRGRLTDGGETVSGTARVVTGAEAEAVKQKIKAKYGLQVTVISGINAVMGLFGRSRTS